MPQGAPDESVVDMRFLSGLARIFNHGMSHDEVGHADPEPHKS